MIEYKFITKNDIEWTNVKEYARKCSWRAGVTLANKMEKELFTDWERVIVMMLEDEITGYCTITKIDCIKDLEYTPYIGFIFVDEKLRGNRLSQKLINKSMEYVKELGFENIYLISDHEGLYEKYGFTVVDKKMAPWGEEEKIYKQSLL